MTSVTPAIAHNHLRAEYIADILWHIYGDASETLLDGAQATFSKSFEQSSALIFKAARRRTVRDGDGDGLVFDGTPQERPATPSESSTLFKRKNSDARIAEIHASIEKALAGDRTSKSANELTDMLSELTVKELREIKTKYGMKASGRTKAEFVAKIAKRLDSGRRADHSVGPGIKLSSEDKYWLQPLLRVHTENRRPDDEQRMMVEAVVSGKPLTPVQKTQAIELFQRKYNELNSTLGVGGNRQGQNQSKAVESVLTKLGVNARQEWKNSAGAINRFPQVPSPVNPEPQRIATEPLPTREEVRASLPPARSAADRAARARAEVMAARASQSDKPIVAPMPVVAKPVSAPVATQYSADQIMQREVLNRAERALRLTKKGRWSGPEITQEDVDRLNARFPNAAPRDAIAKALFSRAMMLKADIRDADGDGMIYDGTPQERAVSKQPVQEKPKNSEKTEENVDSLKARIIRMRDSLLRLPAGKRPKNNIEILNKAGRELFERTGEKLTKDGWVKTQEKTIAKKEQTTDPRFRHASPQAKQDGKKFVVDHEGIKTESASRDTAEADWAHEYEIQNGRRWEPSRQKKDSIQKPPVNKAPEQADRNVAPLPQRDDRLRTRDKVTDAIVGTLFGVKKDIEAINNAVKPREGVTPEQAQAYKAVLNDALKQMPPGMIDNIGKNLKSVEIHKDMWSITKEVHERDGEEYDGKSITFGFFDPRSGSVHLDGNLPEGLALKSGGEFSQRGLYAHELAHAADKLEDGTYFSKSKAWADSYASEINTDATPLSQYARVSPSEGFAEFVRYATENPEEARKNFPKSMKSVESRYGRM